MLDTNSNVAVDFKLEIQEDRELLLGDFIKHSGFAEHTTKLLAADASFRRYVRVNTPKTSYVVMDSPPDKEPIRPFVNVCDHLHKQGHSAPRIIALDEENGFLLLEDLGDDLFTKLLAEENKDVDEKELYSEAVKLLASWQQSTDMVKGSSTLIINDYNTAEYMREIELFTDWYVPELSDSSAAFAAPEFLSIWSDILAKTKLANCYFVHRDFHASNLIWLGERKNTARVGLLDFQDALWGDPSYDLISLLEDARRDVDPKLAEEMKTLYLELTGQPKELFEQRYATIGAQRNLKIIGIFSRLSKRDLKPQYLEYLPRVWRYLENDLAHPSLAKLKIWLDTHVPWDLRK